MEKNKYLIINDLIYDMYRWKSLEDIGDSFFQRLKLVIPFTYASILLKETAPDGGIALSVLTCFPKSFTAAEEKYLTYEYVDDLGWNLYSHESKVIRESDIVGEERRFNTALYKDCYAKFDVYDDLQLTICQEGILYGVLTLFSTRKQGAYSAEDMFFLRSIGMHVNAVFARLCQDARSDEASDSQTWDSSVPDLEQITAACRLTPKESDIVTHLIKFEENGEIAADLGISEHTLQKHLQNIFRKTNVSSKWEFMRKIFYELRS